MSGRILFLLTTLLVLSLSASSTSVAFEQFEYSGEDISAESDLKAGYYRNPILAGFHPDPSLCRVGKDYYLINSTFEYFPGLPIFHSTDLVNWKQIGHVIHRPEQLDYKGRRVSNGLFAPAITYHDGKFYVACTMVDGFGNFVMTAKNPAGPWSDPISVGFQGIDPSLFFDDGRAWIVNNDAPQGPPQYDGHRAIWIQEFDYKNNKMTGPRKMIVNGGVDISQKPVWIEGPHIYKRNDWYYLCCAEGGTSTNHSQVILRSKKVDGSYVPWDKNPILTQRNLNGNVPGAVTSTGHADLEIGPDGNWWAVFLAVRPFEGGFSPMGRETFLLPVTWTEDDWPVILPAGQRVPLVEKAPKDAVVRSSQSTLFNGNFTWREDFKCKDLSLEWIMLREPSKDWWSIDQTAGKLELTPQSEKLYGSGNPSYLGRRVRHATYSAALTVEVPKDVGVSAGLALFMNERHHYFLAVHRNGNNARVYLECVKGGHVSQVSAAGIPFVKEIDLRVETHEGTCSFQYKLKDYDWETLVDDADATIISWTVPDGMFLGATVGLHVRIDDKLSFITDVSTPFEFKLEGNPIFRDTWTADPAPLVVGDTLYVYVGHDDAHGDQMFNITEWLCYSTQDMKTWTAHGSIMKPTDFKWAVGEAWASQMVEKDGKFYFYTTVQHGPPHVGKAIGVAVSDSPTGPFKDARGSALVTDNMTPSDKPWNDIDPTVLIDDDGTAYMAWGNPYLYFAKLKPNMIEIDGDIERIDLPNYTEGPWLHKRGEMYYMTYAAFAHQGMWEKFCYATASKITGPWAYQGILTDQTKNSYTIHPGIVEFKDQWYLFYHNADLTLNGESGAIGRRSVCAEYLYYNPDGTMRPVKQTKQGISIPPVK